MKHNKKLIILLIVAVLVLAGLLTALFVKESANKPSNKEQQSQNPPDFLILSHSIL